MLLGYQEDVEERSQCASNVCKQEIERVERLCAERRTGRRIIRRLCFSGDRAVPLGRTRQRRCLGRAAMLTGCLKPACYDIK